MADRPPMSDVIEEVIEGVIEDNKEVKKKKAYVLSPLRLEALAKAREKAFSLRKEFHDNKEPTVKKERIKKKSKLEVELENRELRASHSHLQKAVALTRPQVDEGDGSGSPLVVNEQVVEKVVDEKVVGDGSGSSPSKVEVVEKVVEKVDEKVVVKTRPSFVRNENGFFCI